jgi:TolB protein
VLRQLLVIVLLCTSITSAARHAPSLVAASQITYLPIVRLQRPQRIAFYGTPGYGGIPKLYCSDPDGANLVLLADGVSLDGLFAWSPDGKQIAYEGDETGSVQYRPDIYVVSADGTGRRALTNDGVSISPQWSPDGAHISFITSRDGTRQLYIMDRDGANQRRLTFGTLADWTYVGGILWSPDGTQIAFGASNGSYNDAQLWVVDLATRTPHKLDIRYWIAPQFEWSPDSQHLLYTVEEQGAQNIYNIRSDGSERHALTTNPAGSSSASQNPHMDRAGHTIVFESNREGSWAIYRMQADGSTPERLTDLQLNAKNPDWLPYASSVSFTTPDGTYIMSPDGSNVLRLAEWFVGNSLYDPSPPVWSPDGQLGAIYKPEYKSHRTLIVSRDGEQHWLSPAGAGEPSNPAWKP